MGCARITFEDPLGNKSSYTRLGRQETKDVVFSKDKDGLIQLQYSQQSADSGNLTEALLNVTKIVLKP